MQGASHNKDNIVDHVPIPGRNYILNFSPIPTNQCNQVSINLVFYEDENIKIKKKREGNMPNAMQVISFKSMIF